MLGRVKDFIKKCVKYIKANWKSMLIGAAVAGVYVTNNTTGAYDDGYTDGMAVCDNFDPWMLVRGNSRDEVINFMDKVDGIVDGKNVDNTESLVVYDTDTQLWVSVDRSCQGYGVLLDMEVTDAENGVVDWDKLRFKKESEL